VVAGETTTRRQILAYAIILVVVSLAPWWIGGTGAMYGLGALALGLGFLAIALPVGLRASAPSDPMRQERRLFAYSIAYLFLLFGALVVDRMAAGQGWTP
jgi:protoheme IX farnesyltransferase